MAPPILGLAGVGRVSKGRGYSDHQVGHRSIQITLDTYSHVAPGLEAAAQSFDTLVKNGNNANPTPRLDITMVKS